MESSKTETERTTNAIGYPSFGFMKVRIPHRLSKLPKASPIAEGNQMARYLALMVFLKSRRDLRLACA